MSDKEKLEMAIEHIKAEIGGLQFAFITRKVFSGDVQQKRANLLDSLYHAVKVLDKARREA
jgi:hypothetical protein